MGCFLRASMNTNMNITEVKVWRVEGVKYNRTLLNHSRIACEP